MNHTNQKEHPNNQITFSQIHDRFNISKPEFVKICKVDITEKSSLSFLNDYIDQLIDFRKIYLEIREDLVLFIDNLKLSKNDQISGTNLLHTIDNYLYKVDELYNYSNRILGKKNNKRSIIFDIVIFVSSIIVSALISVFAPFISIYVFHLNPNEKVEKNIEKIINFQQNNNYKVLKSDTVNYNDVNGSTNSIKKIKK